MDFSYFINNILKFMKTNLIRFHNYKFNDCFRCFTHVLLSWGHRTVDTILCA